MESLSSESKSIALDILEDILSAIKEGYLLFHRSIEKVGSARPSDIQIKIMDSLEPIKRKTYEIRAPNLKLSAMR